MTTEDIIRDLQSRLTPERFLHTMGVANAAKKLALKYGICPQKAYIAGLVHDCAKCMTKDELWNNIQKYDIELDSVSILAPQIWHSYVGAFVARDLYGIDDEQILDAVYYHTTGKTDMTELCAAIYLADAIEEGRRFDGVDYLRTLAEKSLWDAVLSYTEMSLRFIMDRGNLIHPDTVALRNELISNRRQK